jgi:hypothetical protein
LLTIPKYFDILKVRYIKDYNLLKQIYSIFDLTNDYNIKMFENIKIADGPIIKNELQNILKTDGFIFPV